ncbi:cyclic nucleotide-binding domain-containing protein [Sinimarinibacterium sp. CAU 1509]|uniref:serine/threonine-protein kinase n=1 Tax=Sinimarinibacterium sp. CAU 1509 TaxID=2562283 RepID=UPI0010ABA722|nr:serine/threonine-protein kinase [Sinimarinibacterium sp. CAU 1509]TJY63197.1 cyclic nucleotide-binding domain-containing protein [Sinimarinibacterium sp. CAU 1509]
MSTAADSNPPAPTSSPPPRRIGKYDIIAEVGRGACGVVYKAFDPFVRREVAIKLALPADGSRHGPVDERNFFAEAYAAGRLQHPHIVSLYDAGVEESLGYIVMEFIDGDTLVPWCQPTGDRLPLERVVEIARHCAEALHYAHTHGVLHRDVKPGNIMLDRRGIPKLMDFSIAEIQNGDDATGARTVIGSPLYMSPEQICREPMGPASDLYSFGAVLFQLLTGNPPFAHADLPLLFRAIRHQPAPALRALRPDVPPALCEVVDRLLQKQPEQRFESGEALAAALTRVLDQLRLDGLCDERRQSRDSLRRLHFFNGFSDADIDEILSASSMISCAAGSTLIREGESDDRCYILALGSVEVRKGDRTLQSLNRGDCVGEMGFLGATRRTASVVASTPVLALQFNAELMNRVSRDCQLRFYRVFTETLIYRLRLTSARLAAAPDPTGTHPSG